MTLSRGSSRYLRALRLAALALFAACLNPQPDTNPLNRPPQAPVSQGNTPDTTATDPSLAFDDEDPQPPAGMPPRAIPVEAPPSSNNGAGPDAGAPPALDDAGTRQGDLVEDAGAD